MQTSKSLPEGNGSRAKGAVGSNPGHCLYFGLLSYIMCTVVHFFDASIQIHRAVGLVS